MILPSITGNGAADKLIYGFALLACSVITPLVCLGPAFWILKTCNEGTPSRPDVEIGRREPSDAGNVSDEESVDENSPLVTTFRLGSNS